MPAFKTNLICFIFLSTLTCITKVSAFSEDEQDRINLALRKTADALLREAKDSTSHIEPVEEIASNAWRIKITRGFLYEKLPNLLHQSLKQYAIDKNYYVKVKNCDNNKIDVGYHNFDFLNQGFVPCQGRIETESCHYIEIIFLPNNSNKQFWVSRNVLLALILSGFIGFIIYYKAKDNKANVSEIIDTSTKTLAVIKFSQCELDLSSMQLKAKSEIHMLTFREMKLLQLFLDRPNEVIGREEILKEVWEDEGVMVSRTLDVFVSRLRKKLAADEKANIVAVHGIGYKLSLD